MSDLVFVVSENTSLSDSELMEINLLFPNDLIAVLSPDIGNVPEMMRLTHFSTKVGDYSGLDRLLEVMGLSAVVLRPGAFSLLRKSLLSKLITKSLPLFYEIEGSRLGRYRFASPSSGRVVFIYPGIFAPIRNGSTQRAFSLLFGLLSHGHKVEVVMPHDKGANTFALFLEQFGVDVHLFRPGRAQKPLSIARGFAKSALGLNYYLPFFARLRFAISSDYRKTLERVVQKGDTIVVTYAWMTPTFIKRSRDIKIIIDTHDVNFVRDKRYYLSRNIPSRILEYLNKTLELKRLSAGDRIVVISESDRKIIQKEALSAKLTLLEPSFEWIGGVLHSRSSRALNFGFIGSDMIANRLAIEEILNHLWPRLVEARPQATLFIAGGICDYLSKRGVLGENIILLGFVTSLEGYFERIDALVSPIMMQGGLNFKIVESLCCGVPVMVNSDAKYLQSLSPMIYSYENRETVTNFLPVADDFSGDPGKRTILAEEFRVRQNAKFYSALNDMNLA